MIRISKKIVLLMANIRKCHFFLFCAKLAFSTKTRNVCMLVTFFLARSNISFSVYCSLCTLLLLPHLRSSSREPFFIIFFVFLPPYDRSSVRYTLNFCRYWFSKVTTPFCNTAICKFWLKQILWKRWLESLC